MQSAKKAVKLMIDREQKRVLLITINHDGDLIVSGDNVSCDHLEKSDFLRDRFKTLLSEKPDEEDDSYNFDDRLFFKEDPKSEFPKLFAKIDGKKWKGNDIPKALSAYMKVLGFGLNSPRSYGKEEDKPEWWPKRPKWKNFRNPSKASKDECTKLIKKLLEYHGIEAEKYYVNYPCEEQEDSSESSESDSEACGSDLQNNSVHESFGEVRDDLEEVLEDEEDNNAENEDDRRRELLKKYEMLKKKRERGKYVLKK